MEQKFRYLVSSEGDSVHTATANVEETLRAVGRLRRRRAHESLISRAAIVAAMVAVAAVVFLLARCASMYLKHGGNPITRMLSDKDQQRGKPLCLPEGSESAGENLGEGPAPEGAEAAKSDTEFWVSDDETADEEVDEQSPLSSATGRFLPSRITSPGLLRRSFAFHRFYSFPGLKDPNVKASLKKLLRDAANVRPTRGSPPVRSHKLTVPPFVLGTAHFSVSLYITEPSRYWPNTKTLRQVGSKLESVLTTTVDFVEENQPTSFLATKDFVILEQDGQKPGEIKVVVSASSSLAAADEGIQEGESSAGGVESQEKDVHL